MFRNALSSAVQKKFFLMFFTSVIYILGLCAYFSDAAIWFAAVIMIVGIITILRNYLSPKLVLFWYLMFFFAFFNASYKIKNTDALYQIVPQDATIHGQIISIPAGDLRKRFFMEVSEIDYSGKIEKINAKTLVSVFSFNKKEINLEIGDTYKIKGKLRSPFEVSNPSQFDYGKYLQNFGVFTLFYANSADCTLQKSVASPKWRFLQGLNNTRNDIIQAHSKYLKSPNIEVLGGIVFGDDAITPPDEIKASFAHSGLLHILAASGMNVALIYGIWFFILRKLRTPYNFTVISGIFVIIFYSLMTGLGPSVVRAAIMLIFILLGKLMDRDAHSISLLSFVALLMLIYNPAYINDVGFQLSFMVTFGLLVTAPIVFEKFDSTPDDTLTPNPSPIKGEGSPFTIHHSLFTKLPPWLSSAVFIPIIAQIWVAPIQMYYFNSFSLYSVFANIVSLPIVTVISFGGFISAVLALVKPLASPICFIFDLILNPVLSALVAVSGYFASLPHSLIQVPQPSILQIFLYYAIALLVTLILKIGANKKIIVAATGIFLALVILCIHLPDNKLETIAFDVQNADAFLIKTPQNKYFLIDSGKMPYNGGKTQAKMIVLEYLKDHRIKNIEGFVITHFDSDHAGGAIDLINNLNIKNVYVNSLSDKSHLAKKIYKCTNYKKNTHILLAKNNQIIYTEGNLKIKNFVAGLDSDNENSIITLISHRRAGLLSRRHNTNAALATAPHDDFDELFMGDAGVEAFERIKKYLPEHVEILKVGHHGAKNVVNKAFLDRINPDVAIISTGINNYGHPNGVTLNLLEQHQCFREKVKGKREKERVQEDKRCRGVETMNNYASYHPRILSSEGNPLVLRTDRQNAIKIDEENDAYQVYSYSKSGWAKSE
jgi:competence protein ComEC